MILLEILLNDSGFLETKMNLEGISKLLELDIILPNKQFEIRKEFTRDKYSLKSGVNTTIKLLIHITNRFICSTKTNELNMTV